MENRRFRRWGAGSAAPALILGLLAAAGCGRGTVAGMDPVEQLHQAVDAFYAAVAAGDVEARLDLMADDVILMPDHWTLVRGKETIAASLRASAGTVFRIRDRRLVSEERSGDLAYTVNAYDYTWHAAGDSAQWHRTKNVHLWRREAAGWRLAVDIWNSDVPPDRFALEDRAGADR